VLAKGALSMVVLGGVMRGLALMIGNPMTVSMLGAVAVSLIAGRVGIRTEEGGAAARLRARWGGGLGAGPALLGALAALALGASLHVVQPTLTIAFATAEALAVAYRDELWLHGIPLAFALRARVPKRHAAAFAVLAGVAPALLLPGSHMEGLLLSLASSAFFVGLWLRTGDAWAPVAGHFAWTWVVEALLSGELLDLVSPSTHLGRGGGASGVFAWVACAGFVALALLSRRGWPPLSEAQLHEEV
jgi:hypothetical protein